MLTGFKQGAEAEIPAESASWLVGVLLLGAVGALWAGWAPIGQDATHWAAADTAAHRDADD